MNVTFRALSLKRDWNWVVSVLECHFVEDTKGIIAEDENGNRLGVCICDTWTENSVVIHQAVLTPMLLRHGWLEELADYIFNTAGRKLVIGLVPSNNEAALKLNDHIGFTETYRIKDAIADGVDTVIMEIRAEDCTWTPQERTDV